MTESERQSWEQERAQGRDRFILRGMWKRGIRFAIIFSVVSFLIDLLTHRLLSVTLGIWNCVVSAILLALVGSWSEGASIWYKREKEYENDSRHDVV
jgi:cell division protein FtsW (lipid II flippase)